MSPQFERFTVQSGQDGTSPAGAPVLRFAELDGFPIRAALTLRIPGVVVSAAKEVVMGRLSDAILAAAARLAPGLPLVTAEQTHGAGVAVITADPGSPVPAVDALVTLRRDLVLGIAVADCCPVWFWSADGSGIAVAHAGRKGTEAGVAVATALALAREAGCAPESIVAFLGPCIRPPDYEVDIPALLRSQLRDCGLRVILDCGLNTADGSGRFYSYRKEKGQTGRMMAFGWLP